MNDKINLMLDAKMIRLSYDEIVARIKEKVSISDSELSGKINGKMSQLAGLISKEGAAHIVASELGIKLVDQLSGRLQVKNILTGMRDVETVGKVLQVFEERQFSSNGREGKLASLQIADETGSIRAVLWNEQADNVKGISVGDVVKVKSAYVRERNGLKELHLNDRSVLIANPPGETVEVNVPAQLQQQQQQRNVARKKLSELTENDAVAEVLGTIVQVFDMKFFEVCPECGKRARQSQPDSSFVCTDHGATAKPSYSYVLNTVIDDGTETMRLVLFRRMAERLLNKNEQEMLAYRAQPDSFQQVKNDILGNFVKAVVRVNKNELFDRLELIAQEVYEANPDEEISRLNDEITALEARKAAGKNE